MKARIDTLTKIMRDVLIERIYQKMFENKKIFFLSADFGSPALDQLRNKFKDRFINVGIAEQNLINIALGLAIEDFIVYVYAIAPFLTMRAYEQMRVNLSLFSQLQDINVNLIGVGAGLSYDVSGPTHHCLEDLSIMMTLPNLWIFSPCDWVLVEEFLELSLKIKKPKYIRLDSKPLPQIYHKNAKLNLGNGFSEIARGEKICIVSTGYMTQVALRVVQAFNETGKKIGLIDVFLLRPLNKERLYKFLKNYKIIVSLEEAFKGKAGLDCLISNLLLSKNSNIRLKNLGFNERYIFQSGDRAYLHRLSQLDEKSIIRTIKDLC